MAHATHDHIAFEARLVAQQNPFNNDEQNWHQAEANLCIDPVPMTGEMYAYGNYAPAALTYGLEGAPYNRPTVVWMTCREQVERCWYYEKNGIAWPQQQTGTPQFYRIHHLFFCPRIDNIPGNEPWVIAFRRIAQFLRDIEIDCLRLDQISKFRDVQVHTATGICHTLAVKPAEFWYADPCRISFLTLFLRFSSRATNLTQLWATLPSWGADNESFYYRPYPSLAPAIRTFLSGRTKFNGQWDMGTNNFFVNRFRDTTPEACQQLLVA